MAVAKFIGVYACNTWPSSVAATGQKHNWFVWEDGWGRYRAQLLDNAFQPLDKPRVVTEAEFNKHFHYQAHILLTPVSQLMLSSPDEEARLQTQEMEEARKVKQDIAELSAKLGVNLETSEGEPGMQYLNTQGTQEGSPSSYKIRGYDPAKSPEKARPDGTVGTADTADTVGPAETVQDDDEDAAKLDDETRTSFVLAITRWRRGDKRTSMDAFQRILKLEEGIVPAHKHMYTDFAIDLRKCSLTTLAKEFYRRAVQMAPEDCYARFNLARICFETGEIHSALKELNEALRLEPGFYHAERFRLFLVEHYPKQAKSVVNELGGSGGTKPGGPPTRLEF